MNPFPFQVPPKMYSWWTRLKVALFGKACVMRVADPHFLSLVTVYLARCKRHDLYFLDYTHGWRDALWCPRCLEKRLADLCARGHKVEAN